MRKPQVSIKSQNGVMTKKLFKKRGGQSGGDGDLVGEGRVMGGKGGVIVMVPGFLGGGPHRNPRSLSSPKLELWPKN